MRAFLRLEHLFEKAGQLKERSDDWSSRSAVDALIEILSLVSRTDTRSELAKELERQLTTLESLPESPHLDAARLAEVIAKIQTTLESIKSSDNVFGQGLKTNELVNTVRQRSSIPAGTCDFDLPAFRFWLNQPAAQRTSDLSRWLESFGLVREGVTLCLSLIRSSANATDEVATAGFFQRTLDAQQAYSLVRVIVDDELPCFTEISAGKHRFTVRFMEQTNAEKRAAQTTKEVSFRLACCGL